MSQPAATPSLQVNISSKQILTISIPIALAILVPQFNFIINNIFLGALSKQALAIGGITGVYYLIFGVMGQGLNNGLQALISRRAGENRVDEIGILFSQGSIYEGYFKNAMLSGFGIVNIGDEYDKVYQVSYIGEFKEGMLNGFAKKVWPDGTFYEGQWNENELISGTASFPGEFTYSGEISYRGERLTHKSDRFEKKSLLKL